MDAGPQDSSVALRSPLFASCLLPPAFCVLPSASRTPQTTTAQQEALESRDAIVREQEAKDRELRNARIELSTVERQLTSTRERLSRLQFQLETYAKALTTAREDLDLRNKEKADLEAAK